MEKRREEKGEIDFGEWDAESKVNWHKFSKITFTLAALHAPKGYWTSSSTNIYIIEIESSKARQGNSREQDCLMRLIAEFYSFILIDKRRHFRKEPWTSLGVRRLLSLQKRGGLRDKIIWAERRSFHILHSKLSTLSLPFRYGMDVKWNGVSFRHHSLLSPFPLSPSRLPSLTNWNFSIVKSSLLLRKINFSTFFFVFVKKFRGD